jgi:hypothetical protein
MSEKNGFVKAEKRQAKLRLALIGPSKSGKTFTALAIAMELAQGGKVCLIDTERKSSCLYADEKHDKGTRPFDFDVKLLETFNPLVYVDAIHEAEQAGYSVIIVDSLSHAWAGKDGALEMHNEETIKSKSKNSYMAWRNVTPSHNAMIDAIIGCKTHIICTMRSKVEYVQEKDEVTNKTVVRKVGMQPIQREGMDYEFTITGDLDQEHNLVISGTRCRVLDGKVFNKAGKDVSDILLNWLNSGKVALPEVPQVDKFAEAIKGIEEYALDYLIHVGWLKKTEKLADLRLEHQAYVITNIDNFKKAIEKWVFDNADPDIQRKSKKEAMV